MKLTVSAWYQMFFLNSNLNRCSIYLYFWNTHKEAFDDILDRILITNHMVGVGRWLYYICTLVHYWQHEPDQIKPVIGGRYISHRYPCPLWCHCLFSLMHAMSKSIKIIRSLKSKTMISLLIILYTLYRDHNEINMDSTIVWKFQSKTIQDIWLRISWWL